jgi:tripartite-type tricarboxylate transporter receptor subunit TctC
LVARAPSILVVHPSVAASSVKELIALAKSRPGAINYATGASGSTGHLSAELFKSMAAIDIVRVPYKGGGPALIDLISGQVQMLFSSPGSVTPQINSGKLRALAVTSADPSALVPALPTLAASGLPGYEAVGNYSVFAPVGTPAFIVDHLNREIVRTLNRADVKDRYFNGGVETVGSTPQELAAKVKAEMARMGKVIKDAGIRAE